MPQNVASDQGLHCLPLIQQFLDISIVTRMDMFKFNDMYWKVSNVMIFYGKYGGLISMLVRQWEKVCHAWFTSKQTGQAFVAFIFCNSQWFCKQAVKALPHILNWAFPIGCWKNTLCPFTTQLKNNNFLFSHQAISLTFTTLWPNSADDKMIFFLFFPRK